MTLTLSSRSNVQMKGTDIFNWLLHNLDEKYHFFTMTFRVKMSLKEWEQRIGYMYMY